MLHVGSRLTRTHCALSCKVYPLLKYADLPVQRSLYHILRKSIQSRTTSLVVAIEAEANVDVENLPELPGILVELAGEARDENVSVFYTVPPR